MYVISINNYIMRDGGGSLDLVRTYRGDRIVCIDDGVFTSLLVMMKVALTKSPYIFFLGLFALLTN